MASSIPSAVGSSSQPASNPAIEQALAGAKKSKDKKATGSAFPLEVPPF